MQRSLVVGAVAVVMALGFALVGLVPTASAITTNAKQAVVVDAETGRILFQKQARQQMAPSSMTKVMTAYVLFNALRAGQLSMDTT